MHYFKGQLRSGSVWLLEIIKKASITEVLFHAYAEGPHSLAY